MGFFNCKKEEKEFPKTKALCKQLTKINDIESLIYRVKDDKKYGKDFRLDFYQTRGLELDSNIFYDIVLKKAKQELALAKRKLIDMGGE